ncbi:MAG: hypothetical protein ACI3Y6_09120 [Candidatus Cryptobacteroides sp.]
MEGSLNWTDVDVSACRAARQTFLTHLHQDNLDFEQLFSFADAAYMTCYIRTCKRRGLSRQNAMPRYIDSWEKDRGMLREYLHKRFTMFCRAAMVAQVREATITALIIPRLEGAGLPYRIEKQRYRLKVSLMVDGKHAIVFHVRYRDFEKVTVLDGITEAALKTAALLRAGGVQMSLNRCNGKTGWTYPGKGG